MVEIVVFKGGARFSRPLGVICLTGIEAARKTVSEIVKGNPSTQVWLIETYDFPHASTAEPLPG